MTVQHEFLIMRTIEKRQTRSSVNKAALNHADPKTDDHLPHHFKPSFNIEVEHFPLDGARLLNAFSYPSLLSSVEIIGIV